MKMSCGGLLAVFLLGLFAGGPAAQAGPVAATHKHHKRHHWRHHHHRRHHWHHHKVYILR